ncbi:protein cycle isoform X4 [Plutella xylostella]|uniref:protein cycle isoform X4 n=1 Tax=Plutella xylostella TaxID=51655 RepID=UPI0020324B1F|nr:protein cycle isoform X4 [Plutella xylostella]
MDDSVDSSQSNTSYGPNPSSAAPYELTSASGGDEATGGGGGALHPPPRAPEHDMRKRKSHHFSYEDENAEDSRSARSMPDKKQNHSEIEKRRRDKMNTYITELAGMVPLCGAAARKLDKLTVLRLAVQHVRGVRGARAAGPLSARARPAFLSEREANALLLHAAHDAFLFVVGCDRGRLLYVSTSVRNMLHYDQAELVGQSLFDLLHPKDVAKVKEQLSSSDLSPRERLIDAKTMLPVKADMIAAASRFCPGARRSFFCRIKCRSLRDGGVKEEAQTSTGTRKKHSDRKYAVVQCTGYLKSWAPMELCEEGGGGAGEVIDEGDSSLSCLVALGRALPDLTPPAPPAPPHLPLPLRPLQFISRHATDGKFLFVDQRVTLALGFLPQELVGTSLYEYVGAGAVGAVARTHRAALQRLAPLSSPPYAFRRKDGSLATISTTFKPFRNPWTKDIECLVANNSVVTEGDAAAADLAAADYELFKHEPDMAMQRLIDSQVESHKIGSAIAEEALRRSPSGLSPELPPDLLHDVVFSHPTSVMDSILCDSYTEVRNNVPLSAAGASSPPPGGSGESPVPPVSPPLPPLGLDGNGEATMAVIMSLLEADAGLGGPINFSGLPWPLP